jgi:hypothetical protein
LTQRAWPFSRTGTVKVRTDLPQKIGAGKLQRSVGYLGLLGLQDAGELTHQIADDGTQYR